MQFDLDQLETPIVYKLMSACVFPRPIAWVTTQNAEGSVNAAPYSFFNAMGSAPPTLAVGLQADSERGFKDTAKNILENGEFVVNLVSEKLAEAMNVTAVDAPNGIDELQLARLGTTPSSHVAPPRIASAPVAFECVSLTALVTGPCQTIAIGRIKAIHVDEAYVKDAERGHLSTLDIGLVGRTFASGYVRTTDRFDLDRPDWQSWSAEHPDWQPGGGGS